MAECYNNTASKEETVEEEKEMMLTTVINQVVLPAVCLFGVAGNLLNLTILTRQKLHRCFRTLEQAANLCLIFLAVSDLMFCIFAFFTMFLPTNNLYDGGGLLLAYGAYNAAIINVFIMESTWLTVAMSLERYLAICFPLRQDIYLTTWRIKLVIVFTFLFSIFFNIPVIWRHDIVMTCDESSENLLSFANQTFNNLDSSFNDEDIDMITHSSLGLDNSFAVENTTNIMIKFVNNVSTVHEGNIHKNSSMLLLESSPLFSSQRSSSATSESSQSLSPSLHSTSSGLSNDNIGSLRTEKKVYYTIRMVHLGGKEIYDNSYRVIWAFMGNFIPLVLLFYFNVCLCRKIYRSYKLRKHLGRQGHVRSSSHILTITLVAIVVLFFILVAPSEVMLQVAKMTNNDVTPMYKNVEAVLNLMQSVNFSVNFILYCIISPHFRKTLKHLLPCWRCTGNPESREWKKKFETSIL